jgi:hypothetical protein
VELAQSIFERQALFSPRLILRSEDVLRVDLTSFERRVFSFETGGAFELLSEPLLDGLPVRLEPGQSAAIRRDDSMGTTAPDEPTGENSRAGRE